MSLPSGYTRVEYIESSGTQYVDAGLKPDNNTKVVMRVQCIQNNAAALFGSATTYKSNGFECFTHGQCFGTQSAFTDDASKVLYSSSFVDVEMSASGVYKNGTQVATFTAQTFSSPNNLLLLARWRNDGIGEIATAKLASCKIYQSNVLVRDYIPCKNASGTVGLWDDVGSQFYGNAGTGTFTAGPVVLGSHKTMVGGTIYDVTAGKCMVGGTVYDIQKGLTMVGGTIYEIPLTVEPSIPVGTTWTITSSQSWEVPASGNYQVELHGGGGGGSQGFYSTTYVGESPLDTLYAGGGGGGSGQLQTVALMAGALIPITIGSGGTGGYNKRGEVRGAATNGGSSSFGAYFSVAGGYGANRGSDSQSGTNYGAAGAGNIASRGTDGASLESYSTSDEEYDVGIGGYGYSSKPSQTYGNGGNGGTGSRYIQDRSNGSPGQPGACIITYLGT